jgi:hypothetical protein
MTAVVPWVGTPKSRDCPRAPSPKRHGVGAACLRPPCRLAGVTRRALIKALGSSPDRGAREGSNSGSNLRADRKPHLTAKQAISSQSLSSNGSLIIGSSGRAAEPRGGGHPEERQHGPLHSRPGGRSSTALSPARSRNGAASSRPPGRRLCECLEPGRPMYGNAQMPRGEGGTLCR